MAIFEQFSWTVRPQVLAQHETVMDKYSYILKLLKSKIGKLVSFRYFNYMYGGNSPLGGRMLLLEYESIQAYDEFQEQLIVREDFQGFQGAWGQLIFPDSLKSVMLSDRTRNLWFDGKSTEVNNA